jgi:hypothetical protein
MRIIESPVESPFTPESVGDRIQHARRVLGVFLGWDITQAHLATMLRVPEATVADLEGDSVNVSPYAERLCAALGIRRDFLMSGTLPMIATLESRTRKEWLFTIQGMHAPVVAAFSH